MLVPQNKDRLLTDFLKVLIDQGYEGMLEVFQTLLNEAAKIERSEALRAAPYERAKERTGYANGFKDKTVHTRMGAVKLKIPQVRGLEFYPGCIEKGIRSERALKLAVAEMYVQGVSTRKVQKITEELCGFEISSTQVSNLSRLLDEELEQFRNRVDIGLPGPCSLLMGCANSPIRDLHPLDNLCIFRYSKYTRAMPGTHKTMHLTNSTLTLRICQ